MSCPPFSRRWRRTQRYITRLFFYFAANRCAAFELQEMQWRHVHLDRAEWRIPTTKNGEPQIVTLTAEAVEILRSRIGKGSESVSKVLEQLDTLWNPKKHGRDS